MRVQGLRLWVWSLGIVELMVFWVLNFGSGKEFVAVGRMYAWLDGWIDG